jgi:hypothetical protein
MPARSRYLPKLPTPPIGRRQGSLIVKDMRGLNSTDPYGILKNYASPYLRNARMYVPDQNRQVAISTRNGATTYSVPVGETDRGNETSTTGAADQTVSYINAYAQSFTVSAAGVLTKLEIRVKTVAGSSPLTVKIYSDSSGPANLLATSTIPYSAVSSSYGYVAVRFVEAPTVATSTTYWYTVSIDEDTSTTYNISSNTNGTSAKASVNGGINWSSTSYKLNYKAYVSTSGGVKGMTRYYPSSASAVTFFAHGTDIYSVDDGTGAVTSRKSSLNSNATYTRYAQFDDAIFAVNGYDVMQRSTGTTFSNVTAAPFNPINVIVFDLKLFIVDSTNKNLIRYSDEMDYNTWDAANYIYVPESKHSDPITGWIVFQNNLVVFTKNSKYIVSSVGIENFSVRQAIGKKGAVSQEAITSDSNYVYFISGDGKTYRWNGSQDEELSRVIESDFDDIANIDNARLNYSDGKLYYWFQQSGGSVFNRNFVYDTEYKEWFYDNNRYVNGGLILKRDSDRFLLSSDRGGVLYESTDNHSDVGRPIEFIYYTNYFDLGSPDSIKRVRRLYLHLQKTDWAGIVSVGTDTDFADQPSYTNISVKSEGAGSVWGSFTWGSGTYASKDEYKRYETPVPGTATYYQVRIKKTGAETPVYFIGHSLYFRSRRPA